MRPRPLLCLWEGLGALLRGTCMKVSEGEPGTCFTREQGTAVKSVTQNKRECSADSSRVEAIFKQKDTVTAVNCSPLCGH